MSTGILCSRVYIDGLELFYEDSVQQGNDTLCCLHGEGANQRSMGRRRGWRVTTIFFPFIFLLWIFPENLISLPNAMWDAYV